LFRRFRIIKASLTPHEIHDFVLIARIFNVHSISLIFSSKRPCIAGCLSQIHPHITPIHHSNQLHACCFSPISTITQVDDEGKEKLNEMEKQEKRDGGR
jgi:hypothetical protein